MHFNRSIAAKYQPRLTTEIFHAHGQPTLCICIMVHNIGEE